MEDQIFSNFNAILLLIALAFVSLIFIKYKFSNPKNPLPPEISGGWPVIGHLLQFSGADDIPLSRKLSTFADKYGAVFTFRLGLPRVLVVSSYDAVKDCLNFNDKVFAARPASLAGEYIGYNNAMLFLASYGDYWRKIRKIVLQEVLSSSRLEKLKSVRVCEVQTSIKELYALIPAAGAQSSVTGESADFSVGDNVDLLETEGNVNFSVIGDKFKGNRSRIAGESVNFPVIGDAFPGNQSLVAGEGANFTVTGGNNFPENQSPVAGENVNFPMSRDNFPGNQSPVAGESVNFPGNQSPIAGENVNFPVKVNITNWIEKLTLSLIVKMIAGKSYGRLEKGGDDEEAEKFKKALKDFMYISMEFVLWDAFPIPLFKWIDFQGHVKFMKRTFQDIDCVLQNWLDEHVKKRERVDVVGSGNEEDFIDVMLSMMSHEDFVDGYSRETTIKATALSMVLDASDTTAIHLNWVMATLLNHRDAMRKVQEELDTKVGRNRWVEESDIKNLVYFQAVVKETLRLYPPAPLLVPHESVQDCIIQGYHIPKLIYSKVLILEHHQTSLWI